MKITGLPYRDSPARWRIVRANVFNRDGYRCQQCGKAGVLECDHKLPLADGGEPWAMSNLRALCRGCHIRITAEQNRARKLAQQAPKPGRDAWQALVSSTLDINSECSL